MKTLRIYVDTSVFGGCMDEEFATDSLRLCELAKEKLIILLVSSIVIRELEPAPLDVREVFQSLPLDAIEEVVIDQEILALRDAYIAAGVVGARWKDDAAHVAAATVARADAIVSWNFKHIVRLDRMKEYNKVNVLNGYGLLTIITPREVQINESDENEENV